ncbi:hypothetical protein ACFORL_07015 [Legionella dresdenensis]|uniref:Uncharacterized protein n=1 Tax=Legionella dresdenensis TaxID=450200 RepID=A0ABV8CFN8_9GAMM
MSNLLREYDNIMIKIRSQFEQLGWFSRLFFPSEMKRFLLQFYISKMDRSGSSAAYQAQYGTDAVFGFCKNYHHFITDNSLSGRFRRWLLDFFLAFNSARLMNMWRFTNEQQLGKEEFAVLVSYPNAAAFQNGILVFKRALANDGSQTLQETYKKYLKDLANRAPLFSSPEGFAALLITSCNRGLAYNQGNDYFGEIHDAREKMLDVFRDNLSAFASINTSLQRLSAGIHFANLISLEQVVKLFKDNKLNKWVDSLNALHLQTMNSNTSKSALHENPGLIKLLMKHPEPENLGHGLVKLWQLGLCIKTNLLKAGQAELSVFEKNQIKRRAVETTHNNISANIDFYTRGYTTEADLTRAFEKIMSEQAEIAVKAAQKKKKFDVRFAKFNKLSRKYQLPASLHMSDLETSGLNVLRLAHHPYPERVVNALGKFRFRDAASYADERACREGSANGWGFALGDMSLDFFNYIKSEGLNVIYDQLLNYSQIFLHEDVMPYWEKIQNNELSPVHFLNIYWLCVQGLSEGAAKEGSAIARKGVIDYLQNISDKQNNYSLMTETALMLMFMHGAKIQDEKLNDMIAGLMVEVGNAPQSIDCIKRLNREQFVDAETDISASQLLVLTWIALQKMFAKNKITSLKSSTIIDLQLSAFQDAHTAGRFAGKSNALSHASTSEVRPSLF